MRIAIIGTGKMGRGFAQALAPTHEVIVGSRDPHRASVVAAKAMSRAVRWAHGWTNRLENRAIRATIAAIRNAGAMTAQRDMPEAKAAVAACNKRC